LKVETGGSVAPQGMNLPGVGRFFGGRRVRLDWVLRREHGVDLLAVSFVRHAGSDQSTRGLQRAADIP
jgi:hypothetical protein